MRIRLSIAALFLVTPLTSWADEFAAQSSVTGATLYPDSATITRQTDVDMPAGKHRIVLSDIPANTDLTTLRVALSAGQLASVTTRTGPVPPVDRAETPAITDARAEVERLREAVEAAERDVEAVRLERRAAQAQLEFISRIGDAKAGEGLGGATPQDLADFVGLIGAQTLAAERAAFEADARVAKAQTALDDIKDDLADAEAALAALLPETEDRAQVVVDVNLDTAEAVGVTLQYETWRAGWQAGYDLQLSSETSALAIARSVLVQQDTGENWRGVALTLSTARPSQERTPADLWPNIRRIEDPLAAKRSTLQLEMADSPVLAAPTGAVVAEARFQGLTLVFDYPEPVDLGSGADMTKLALDTKALDATVVARAVPMLQDRAFVVAKVENTTGEVLLPGTARYFLDGTYIGAGQTDLVAAGADTEFAFGAIDGLTVSRRTADRMEGDSGLLTKSNETDEVTILTARNTTDRAWQLELIDRVSVSEQEDLRIDWTATPSPTTENWDDRRGVLAWEVDLAAGETFEVRLGETLKWPEGKILR